MARKIAKKLGKNVSSKKTKAGKKWVIAVDPFSNLEIHQSMAHIKNWAEKCSAELGAEYVLSPSALNWTGEFSGPWVKRYLPVAQQKLAALENKVAVVGHIHTVKAGGVRAAVKGLLQSLDKQGAEMLVMATHSKTGLERFTLGSFTETAVLAGRIPMIVFNPLQTVAKDIKKILVPLDMTKKSKKLVLGISSLAKSWDAELILLHKQPDPLDPIIQQGVYSLGGGWVSAQAYMSEELEKNSKELKQIAEKLKASGIKARTVMENSPMPLIETINKAAKDNQVDMTAVMTEAGSWTAAILGSVARSLVRTSPVPVLIRR